MIKRIHWSVSFKWYDIWIGAYWDRIARILYVCPIPMVAFKFWRKLP